MTGARYIKPQGELQPSQFGDDVRSGLDGRSAEEALGTDRRTGLLEWWPDEDLRSAFGGEGRKAPGLAFRPFALVTPPPSDDDPLGSNPLHPRHFNSRSGSSLRTALTGFVADVRANPAAGTSGRHLRVGPTFDRNKKRQVLSLPVGS